MTIKTWFRVLILASFALPTWVYSQTVSISDLPCEQRGVKFCQLPNAQENCSVGTCDASLSSSGNCTIEAMYNNDNSAILSCRVCSTEDIIGDACRSLGGTVRPSS
jgi:hypothetical protein